MFNYFYFHIFIGFNGSFATLYYLQFFQFDARVSVFGPRGFLLEVNSLELEVSSSLSLLEDRSDSHVQNCNNKAHTLSGKNYLAMPH